MDCFVLAWSVDGQGFKVLHHEVKLHRVFWCGFPSNIVHRFLQILCVGDDLTFLVGDGEIKVLHHAAKVWRRVSMV